MKLYVFKFMKSLKDWGDGYLVVMAEDEDQLLEVVKDTAEQSKGPALGHHFGMKTYREVTEILKGNTEDYRKPNVVEEPAAVGFVGSA